MPIVVPVRNFLDPAARRPRWGEPLNLAHNILVFFKNFSLIDHHRRVIGDYHVGFGLTVLIRNYMNVMALE
jgi:hypothetical protein